MPLFEVSDLQRLRSCLGSRPHQSPRLVHTQRIGVCVKPGLLVDTFLGPELDIYTLQRD